MVKVRSLKVILAALCSANLEEKYICKLGYCVISTFRVRDELSGYCVCTHCYELPRRRIEWILCAYTICTVICTRVILFITSDIYQQVKNEHSVGISQSTLKILLQDLMLVSHKFSIYSRTLTFKLMCFLQ